MSIIIHYHSTKTYCKIIQRDFNIILKKRIVPTHFLDEDEHNFWNDENIPKEFTMVAVKSKVDEGGKHEK